MPIEIYRTLHLFAIMLLFTSIGGLALYVAAGGSKAANPHRKLVSALHGTAAFLVLLGGFGMLARLNIAFPFPLWVWIKLTIWTLLSVVIMVPYRKPELAKPLFVAAPVLGLVAAWVALFKPA